MKYQKFS